MLLLRSSDAAMRHFRENRNFHSSSHNDDTSLWSLIQRVCRREDDKERRVVASNHLLDFISKPDNKNLISRSLEQILNALIDVFFERSGVELQKDVANIIGRLGQYTSSDPYPFFQWLLRQFQSIANDNVRNYLLESLNKLLELDFEERKYGKVIGLLMDQLQEVLENLDSPSHLPLCINPLVMIAVNYPQAFAKHFRDTVDILVGWHIDHTQKMSLTLFASESLIKLHAHWLTDLQFSLTLLSQFLEDMEAYAEDYHKLQNGEINEDDTSVDSCLPKMAALMRVFSTVVRSIGPVFHANNGPPITEVFILETLQRIIVCAQLAGEGSLPVTSAADECARLLLGAVQWRGEDMLSESLLTYAVHAVERSRSEARLLLVLDFITVMVQEVGSALPAWFIQGLLGPSSRLLSLKHARNPTLTSELLALYQACLAVKSVPLLQTAYKHVTGELQHAVNGLLTMHACNVKLDVVQDNPFSKPDDVTDHHDDDDIMVVDGNREERLLKTVMFDVVALLEVADARNSLIGMYALSPIIFDFLHSGLDLVHKHLSMLYPELQYSILHVLYSHCQRHKNFVSSFLGGSPAPQVDSVGGVGPSFIDNVNTATHQHFPSILTVITGLLIQESTSSDARTLLLHWCDEILDRLKLNKDPLVFNLPQFLQLIQAIATVAMQNNISQSILASKSLRSAILICSSHPTSSSVHHLVIQSSLIHIWSSSPLLRDTYADLLLTVPVDSVLQYCYTPEHTIKQSRSTHRQLSQYGHRESWLAKRATLSKPGSSGMFHAHHFKDIMERMLKPLSARNTIPNDWLEQLYWSSQRRENNQSEASILRSRSPCPLTSLWSHDLSFVHWVSLWRTAEYTVVNKLRTPLGRPQDTFQRIEGAIRDFEAMLFSSVSTPSKPLKSKLPPGSPRNNPLSTWPAIQRPYLLLQFLDHLEKLLYNAYEGCAIAIQPPNKAVRTFFYTNRQTCDQWMNRLRLAVMHISLASGMPALAFQHGQAILYDMMSKTNTTGLEFELAVSMTTEALVELGSPQSLEGLLRWCRGVNKTQYSWIKIAKYAASKNYEDAVKEFKSIYNARKNSESSVDVTPSNDKDGRKPVSPSRAFVSKQILKCYHQLGCWDEIEAFKKQISTDDSTKFSTNLDQIRTLGSFDKLGTGMPLDAKSIPIGGKSPGTPINGLTTGVVKAWCWDDLLVNNDAGTIRLLLANGRPNAESLLAQNAESSLNCIKLSSAHWPPSVDYDFYSMFAITSAAQKAVSQKQTKLTVPLSAKLERSDWMVGSCGTRLLTYIEQTASNEDDKIDKSLFDLRLGMMKMNRKHNNLKKAQRLLMKQISMLTKEDCSLSETTELIEICRSLPESAESMAQSLKIRHESGKLLQATGHGSSSMALLAESVEGYLGNGHKSCGDICAQSILTLVKYMQSDWKNVGPELKDVLSPDNVSEKSTLSTKIKLLMEIEQRIFNNKTSIAFSNNQTLIPEVNHEIAIGSLLNLATSCAPEMAKAWFTMAGWCYKWGRKIMDSASSAGSVELTETEKHIVRSTLSPLGVDEEQIEQVYAVLRKAHCSTASAMVDGEAVDDISMGDRDQSYTDVSEVVMEQLRSNCGVWLTRAPPQTLTTLLSVWQLVCMRLFTQYRLAAEAYFKFLNLNAGDQASLKHEDSNVTATLRLLRLLVKHALELQGTLKTGLASTSTLPWKGIIPQLFSRLNHPESYVRRSIADLLCRVVVHSSHLIIYPVVVATMRSDPLAHSALRATLDEQDEQEEEEENERNKQEEEGAPTPEDTGVTNSCYQQVLQALVEQDSGKVRDVQISVHELRRITLLWDELWLGTLSQHQHDIMRRLQQLQDEAKRVNTNSTLSKSEKQVILREQQQAIMRPVLYAMRRVYRITRAAPETPHERWFAENLQPMIDQALEKLQNPPNPYNPQSCWAGFKQVHTLLQNRASKRAAHILNLGEISPRLMTLKSTSMPIPGVTDTEHPIAVEGCSSAVTILPTKTKPKKLQFIGSDGRRYTYLFKGLEDLHLDERVMQFLSIANRLLRRQHQNRGYMARHYSVTPLGPRSGLIQWVSGATPLFLLYKRWQQRQAIVQANKAATSPGTNPSQAPTPNLQIMRPSDLYYSKLNPAMKKAEIDVDRISRKDWPVEVLRSVLNELIDETPSDLLQKELWCSATGASEYWSMQQNYSQSTAVMSMIGHVIGLGDRHLDNVLVDLETGEVVHIDYNVCFEKGLQLRVPERVPFRLTQNLKMALGITGVEGVFRNSCEQVMGTLRKGRETLLTLLEAFVYDPLVDWTGTVEGGYAGAVYGGGGQQAPAKLDEDKLSKKDMERDITRSLFSSRVAEMKQGWFTNRDEMLKVLPTLVEKLNDYKNHFKNNLDLNENIQNLLEVKSLVKSALSDSRHPYNTLPSRWHQQAQQQAKREVTLATLQDKILVCEEHMKRYVMLNNVLQGPELAGLLADATTKLDIGDCAFEHASKFLHSAGQANMVSQAQMTEKELVTVGEQHRHAMRSCLDALSQYAAVAAHFPPVAALRGHRMAVWRDRLEKMVDGLLDLNCSAVRSEIERQCSKEAILAQTRAAAVKDAALQREVSDLNGGLVKLLERRSRESVVSGRLQEAERMVQTSQDHIIKFVQEHGLEGLGSFTGVLTMLLCALDQRAIAMETTAANAGHRLVDMTSQEGDWFLEELCGLFSNMVQLLRLADGLLNASTGSSDTTSCVTRESTRAVICVDNIYRTLLELFKNFRNIIVPEAVKLLQCEEPSVVELVAAVSGIVQGVRIDDLTKQLTASLRSQGTQNGTTAAYEEALAEVQRLQQQYNQLLHDSRQRRTDEHRLTAGQMLLQAFDGLFRSAHKDFNALLVARDGLMSTVPHEWSFVDCLSGPIQLQKFKKLSATSEALQALLFAKQLQAMNDFFVLCHSNARAFVVDRLPPGGKNAPGAGHHYMGSKNLYTEERLAKPVKHFVSHFVQELLIGIPGEMLGFALCGYVELLGVELGNVILPSPANQVVVIEQICKTAVETKYSQSLLAKPSMLVYQFNRTWKDLDRARRLDSNIASMRASLHRAQLQVTRFQWLFEDLLEAGGGSPVALPRRRDVTNDLSKRMSALRHLEAVLQQVQDKASSQNTSIQSRLKWAAGANPSLQTVLASVEADAKNRSKLVRNEQSLSMKILDVCENAVSFEQSRLLLSETNKDHDSEFFKLLEACEGVCRVVGSSPVQLEPLEQTAAEILPPKQGTSSKEWLQKVSEKIHQSVTKYKQQRHQEESKMLLVKSNLRDLVTSVKQLLSSHGRLLSDVKTLLKTMAKEEDGEEDSGGVRRYMGRYKELTSSLNDALMDVLQGCDVSTMLDPDPLILRVTEIAGMVASVYEDLVSFANPYIDNPSNQPTFASALRTGTGLSNLGSRGSPGGKKSSLLSTGGATGSQSVGTPNTPPMVAIETGSSATKVGTASPKKKVRDPRTGKAIQERNYFAMSVWRRVKAKLDGRDIEPNKRVQVSEQVDQVITEATSLDNLALLYEGWTAWV